MGTSYSLLLFLLLHHIKNRSQTELPAKFGVARTMGNLGLINFFSKMLKRNKIPKFGEAIPMGTS